MKHAYCIIAHNEPYILKKLIELIDDERNDIFILIDQKSDIRLFKHIKSLKSKIIYTPRIDIRWGDISLIIAELILFETASKQDKYQYYHLLSGVDLPIKSQNYIHDFMDKHNGKEFVGFAQEDKSKWDIKRKTRYYYIFTKYNKSSTFTGYICRLLRNIFIYIQCIFRVKRKFHIEIKKGCNWVSITHDLCTYILEKKQYILKTFKYTLAPDEMFIQTIIWQSRFKNNIYKHNEFDSCLREIDWERGTPYVWGQTKDDINILKKSNKLFARKFSSKNIDFIDIISKDIVQDKYTNKENL